MGKVVPTFRVNMRIIFSGITYSKFPAITDNYISMCESMHSEFLLENSVFIAYVRNHAKHWIRVTHSITLKGLTLIL